MKLRLKWSKEKLLVPVVVDTATPLLDLAET